MRARLGHRPELDGIRGVAILAVLGYHALGHPSGGFLGVALFFVLSGFLITTLLMEEWEDTASIGLRAFYGRRARRLFPALGGLLCLAASLLVVPETAGGRQLLAQTIFFAATYSMNVIQAVDSHAILVPFSHLWSLAAEEQFYVLWPISFLVLLRRRVRVSRICWALAALTLLSAAESVALALAGAGQVRLYYAPDTGGAAIVIGCLVALLRGKLGPPGRRLELLAVATIAGFLILAHLQWRGLYAGGMTLFAVAAGVLVLAAVEGGWVGRVLRIGPLTWVGRISYSLYLWHWPVIYIFRDAFGPLPLIAVSFLLAAGSYYLIERPFRRRRAPLPAPSTA